MDHLIQQQFELCHFHRLRCHKAGREREEREQERDRLMGDMSPGRKPPRGVDKAIMARRRGRLVKLNNRIRVLLRIELLSLDRAWGCLERIERINEGD